MRYSDFTIQLQKCQVRSKQTEIKILVTYNLNYFSSLHVTVVQFADLVKASKYLQNGKTYNTTRSVIHAVGS